MGLRDQVLEAVMEEFKTQDVEDQLSERDGRVFGAVVVSGSGDFERANDLTRYKRFWKRLAGVLKSNVVNVGPILLVNKKDA